MKSRIQINSLVDVSLELFTSNQKMSTIRVATRNAKWTPVTYESFDMKINVTQYELRIYLSRLT